MMKNGDTGRSFTQKDGMLALDRGSPPIPEPM